MDRGRALVPVPAELRQRVAAVGAWVRAPGFDAREDEDRALARVAEARADLELVRLRRRQAVQDQADWDAAVEWVRADAAEVEAELMESLAKTVPRRRGETLRGYRSRLEKVRAAFRRGPGMPSP